MGQQFDETFRLSKQKREIVRQVFTVIYNCRQAPEQWERGHRLLSELLDQWDAPAATTEKP